MSIGARIRQARKNIGFSQTDLADRLKVSQPTVANWESGAHDPRRIMQTKIADTLGVKRDWLASGQMDSDNAKPYSTAYVRRPIIHTPLISWENAAGASANGGFDPYPMAEEFIPVTAKSTNLFALFMEDEAMNLAFPRDTLVVIDYENVKAVDGGFVLASVQGQAVLRRWRDTPPRLEPYSSNPNHDTIYADADTQILGCAVVSIRFH
ncbi:MAG: helix-turn-helix domain-containing protein [Pseudomonadota bacterium]